MGNCRTAVVAVAACVVATACRPPAVYRFSCPGGAEVRVRYAHDSAYVQLPTGVAVLPFARSGSGARYANDTLEFWEHAGAVRITRRIGAPRRDTLVYQGCRAP